MAKPEGVVLITGIGGDVGVGAARNIRRVFGDRVTLLGTNIWENPSGGYLCDDVAMIPRADDKAYLPTLSDLITKHGVKIVIPGTDPENVVLSKADFGEAVFVATSPAETVQCMNDKWKSACFFEAHGIPFVPGMLASEYDGRFETWLAKPRCGHGSRGIVGPKSGDLEDRSEQMIVQPWIEGDEFTSAFYVDSSNNLVGSITFRRNLSEGRTVACEVDLEMDARVRDEVLVPLISETAFVGSANLQFFRDPDGKILPFEVNCRLSGTSSIRSAFGFNDAELLIRERLFGEKLVSPTIRSGCAIRTSSDVVFYNCGLDEPKTALSAPTVW